MLKEMRRRFPDDRLTVFCRKGLGTFLVQAELVDEVIEADKSCKKSWAEAVRRLKAKSFGLIICPHESFRSAWLVSRLKGREKIGYSRFFNRLMLSQRIRRPMELPEALRQLALLQTLWPEMGQKLREYEKTGQARPGGRSESGLAPVPEWAEMTVPKLVRLRAEFRGKGQIEGLASQKTRDLVNRLQISHGSGRKTAFLAPGSVWPTKRWTVDGYIRVARELQSKGYRVILTGSEHERALCAEIVQRAPGAESVAGETTLFESAELFALSDLLVCNDSGAMHLAATASLPSVSVFGPTVLDFGYRPWQRDAKVVEVDLKCRPCGKHGAKTCPIGTHECMRKVSAEMVLAVTEELMNSNDDNP